MVIKTFYRVNHIVTKQGLWYDQKGQFTGLIHGKFSFCLNSKLAMEFDEEIVGYMSATESLEDLYKWFTVEDILMLQNYGYYIHVYEVTDYKFYERFKHYVINQKSSVLVKSIVLDK